MQLPSVPLSRLERYGCLGESDKIRFSGNDGLLSVFHSSCHQSPMTMAEESQEWYYNPLLRKILELEKSG